MSDDTAKPETDTAVLRRVVPGIPPSLLKRITLPAVWTAVLSIVGIAITGATRVAHDENSISNLETRVQAIEKEQETLRQISSDVNAIKHDIDHITDEVNRQRDWREKVEDVAEIPPHARRKAPSRAPVR